MAEDHRLIDPPAAGIWQKPVSHALHYAVYPVKFMLFMSVPDVRLPGKRRFYGRSIWMCCLWLAIFSFIMIECSDRIGAFFRISPMNMGLTMSAIGTSFPNLWSSILVARAGNLFLLFGCCMTICVSVCLCMLLKVKVIWQYQMPWEVTRLTFALGWDFLFCVMSCSRMVGIH